MPKKNLLIAFSKSKQRVESECILQNLSQNGLELIARMENLSQNELKQIVKMEDLLKIKLEQIAKARRIKNYKNMSRQSKALPNFARAKIMMQK